MITLRNTNNSMTFTSTITYHGPSLAPGPSLTPTLSSMFSAFGSQRCIFPSLPSLDTMFDIITIALIICFVILCLVSLAFIIHLRLKSCHKVKLQSFTSHWTARFLLIILLLLWTVNEFLRLPIFRKSHVFPFSPPFDLPQQTQYCKFHLILSFGLFEPGFLVTLLYLVNTSINKLRPSNLWAIAFVGMTCLPLLVSLYFAVFVLPEKLLLLAPTFYHYSVLVRNDDTGKYVVYCTYPLLSTVIFGVFGVVYALALLGSCWKVVSLAINKRLRARVNALALIVISCLSAQVVMLIVCLIWDPDNIWYDIVVLINFMSVLVIGALCLGILIIKPVNDTLQVEGGSRSEQET